MPLKSCVKSLANLFLCTKLNFCKEYKIGKGSYIRHAILSKYVSLGRGCQVSASNIGKCSYLGNNVYLPFTKIGAFCSIASGVTLGAGNHPFSFVSTHPSTYKKNYMFPTRYVSDEPEFDEYAYTDNSQKYYCEIGNDVWISTNALLLCGKNSLHIGHGAIVRGGAVVTKDVPPYAIVQGCPAKIIGYRFSQDIIQKLLTLKWWEKSDEWLKKYNPYFSDPEQLFFILKEE